MRSRGTGDRERGVGKGAALRAGRFMGSSRGTRAPFPTPHPPSPIPFRLQAGVTLVEVLIAVTLLSLLTLGMLLAMRIGLNTLAKTDNKLMTNRRVAGAQRIVENELEGLMPVTLTACGKQVFPGSSGPVLFEAREQTMRLVSAFSLQQAWRGQPQILEMFVIPSEDGRGVRLVVNETPYSPVTAGMACQALVQDQVSMLPAPQFLPPQTSEKTFVLADRLAYCKFSYLMKAIRPDQPPAPKWLTTAPAGNWPMAIRIDMAPLERDLSLLQPISVTAPIYVHRGPTIEYGDY